jgi:predicted phage tail component-like protein
MQDFFTFDNVLSTDKNIVLKDYSPIFLPATDYNYIEIPGRDGSVRKGSGSRRDVLIRCEVAMIGTTQDIYDVNAWLSNRGGLSFWDMPDKYYIGELYEEIPMLDMEEWKEFDLYFRCHPVKYGADVNTSLSGSTLILNSGTYETFPVIETMLVTAETTLEFTHTNTGEKITMSGSYGIGDVIVVDFENEEITQNGNPVNDDLHLDSDFFKLAPGENTIVSSVDATIHFTERWL